MHPPCHPAIHPATHIPTQPPTRHTHVRTRQLIRHGGALGGVGALNELPRRPLRLTRVVGGRVAGPEEGGGSRAWKTQSVVTSRGVAIPGRSILTTGEGSGGGGVEKAEAVARSALLSLGHERLVEVQ